MTAYREIYEDAPEFIAVPKTLQHKRLEVVLLPLDKIPAEKSLRKRKPPAHFAGRVREFGDVMNSLSAQDWGLVD